VVEVVVAQHGGSGGVLVEVVMEQLVTGVAVVGTVNLGGGGGGSFANGASHNGSSGGKGVVILSMPDADYSGTTTGSPTVATGCFRKNSFNIYRYRKLHSIMAILQN
jgi:hypothetical protein